MFHSDRFLIAKSWSVNSDSKLCITVSAWYHALAHFVLSVFVSEALQNQGLDLTTGLLICPPTAVQPCILQFCWRYIRHISQYTTTVLTPGIACKKWGRGPRSTFTGWNLSGPEFVDLKKNIEMGRRKSMKPFKYPSLIMALHFPVFVYFATLHLRRYYIF